MLRTSTWTRSIGRGDVLHAETLMQDFEKEETLAPIPARGLQPPSLPERPYIHGASKKAADLLRETWNRQNPHNPMP